MEQRLIDANAYAAELCKLRENYQMLDDTHTADKIMHGIFRAEQTLKEQPTVDAVPVQRKSVVGYEGLYEVDSLSRIFSKISGKQMKQWTTTRGYKSVSLTKNGKEKNVFVHRIVAEAFVPNRKGYPFVNHKDEDKTNNLPENLEWCTAKYNSNYGTAVKRRLETLKRNGTSTRGRPSEKQKQIVAVDENGNEFVFSNSYEAAEKTGVDRRNIFACCQGKKNRLKGYKFDWFCADGERKEQDDAIN